MKLKTIKSLCGMLAMLAFTACSSNSDDAGSSNDRQVWTVTLQASMGDAATLRTLSEGSDNALIAEFAENDEVVVVDADGSTIVGTLKAKVAGASTTLTGDLDATSLSVGEVVTLRYLSATANYDGQVGTLAGISANQNYAEGTLTVSTTSPLTFTSNSVNLNSKQSITKFTFSVKVKTFGIAATGLVQSIATNGVQTIGAVTGTLATSSKDVYVALRNKESGSKTYSFTIQDESGNWYIFTKNANLENGKNYTASVTLSDKLPALTNSSAVGTIGVVGGLPAIAISGNKAVALMNAGALCPEAYGTYYTYENRASGLTGAWYVPSDTELLSLKTSYTNNAWEAQNDVYGYRYTIGSNTLFLPAAGFYDNTPPPSVLSSVTSFGYYWSATNYDDDEAYSLQFSSSVNNTYGEYKTDGLSVRPFHSLP